MEKLINDFKISFTKGDTYALAVKFKNITDDLRTAFFTVKENADDEPLIQKTLGAGISKIDDRVYKKEKTYKVQIEAIDTANLEANVQYLYDLQVTLDNVVKTVLSGVFVVSHSVTGITAMTTSTLEVAVDDEVETEVATAPATNGVEYEQDPVACAKIGDLTALKTTERKTIVEAVNEVKTGNTNTAEKLDKVLNGTFAVPKATDADKAKHTEETESIISRDGINKYELSQEEPSTPIMLIKRHGVSLRFSHEASYAYSALLKIDGYYGEDLYEGMELTYKEVDDPVSGLIGTVQETDDGYKLEVWNIPCGSDSEEFNSWLSKGSAKFDCPVRIENSVHANEADHAKEADKISGAKLLWSGEVDIGTENISSPIQIFEHSESLVNKTLEIECAYPNGCVRYYKVRIETDGASIYVETISGYENSRIITGGVTFGVGNNTLIGTSHRNSISVTASTPDFSSGDVTVRFASTVTARQAIIRKVYDITGIFGE